VFPIEPVASEIVSKEILTLSGSVTHRIKAVLIDFGGVLAEEGFKEGLMAIGRKAGLSPEIFFKTAEAAVYDSGYVLGKANEKAYWNMVRARTGVSGQDEELRGQILGRFTIRTWMLEIMRALRQKGYRVCILSDQSQWLDELNDKYDFFRDFDEVFNSYHMGNGKRDPKLFADVASRLGFTGEEILFVDDNEGNIRRAAMNGWNTILFRDRESFVEELKKFVELD
jgi:putative hydrolase of the HAD superfamily